jgi:acyl-CoA reductase-like NAD-dependent aldehyde dehydrogenase
VTNPTGKVFIGGAWSLPSGDATIDVVNPATGEVVGSVGECSPGDVDRAVGAARDALESWAATPLAERIALVARIRDGIAARREELAASMSREMGAPIAAARGQMVTMALNDAEGFLRAADALELSERVGSALVVKEPVGVVVAITPWNAPMHQMALKLLPALIAGCTVVLKPSEVTPTSASLLFEIAADAGTPRGVLNLVTGSGPRVGAYLAAHPDVDMVSFTGSVEAGRSVAAAGAQGVKKVTLELGGKSACVVLDDADLAAAVTQVVAACFRNSGQVCAAITRLLVPHDRLAEVEALAVRAAGAWPPGDPSNEQTVLGPVSSRAARARVRGYIEAGVAEGARLLYGGAEDPEGLGDGAFVRPTIFTGVRPEMRIAQEEIFGPVLSLIGYHDEEEAVRIANGTRYGLVAAVWSADPRRAQAVARRLRAGVVRINGGGEEIGTPFGGYRASGVGREGGAYGIEEFFELKTISAPPSVTSPTG